MIAFHRKGQALFLRYSRGNGTFDQPSAVTWCFFNDVAMQRAPTYEKTIKTCWFSTPKNPPPTSWPNRANFVNRQRAGEAVLEGLHNWIRPNTDVQKRVNVYFGPFPPDIAIEMAPICAHLSWW